MELLSLNEDILYAITSFLQHQDAFRFALTSRYAETVSLPHRVRSVTLKNAAQIGSFCAYILAENSLNHTRPRAVFIRTLVIQYEPIESLDAHISQASALTDVLRRATGLRSLTLMNLILDATPQSYPDVKLALGAHTALRHIVFWFAGDEVSAMFSTISAPLEHIELCFPKLSCDLGTAITPFVHSLRTLVLSGHNSSFVACLDGRTVYPHVHTLELGRTDKPPATLARAFPNLRSLRISKRMDWEEEQLRSASDWPGLDSVIASDALPLTCRVRNVDLLSLGGIVRYEMSRHIPRMLAFLQRSSPTVLSCVAVWELLRGLPSSTPTIRYLSLRVMIPGIGTSFELPSRIAGIVCALQLVGISFGIMYSLGRYPDAASFYASDAQVRDIAADVARQIPTLQYVSLTVVDEESRRVLLDVWLRVVDRKSGDVTVEAVSKEEGLILRERLLALGPVPGSNGC